MPEQNKTKVPLKVHSYLLDEPLEEWYLTDKEKRYVLDSNEFVVGAKETIIIGHTELVKDSVKATGE